MNRGQQAYMASLKFGSNPKANKAKDTNNELKFDELVCLFHIWRQISEDAASDS
jgi:hypothetical protein